MNPSAYSELQVYGTPFAVYKQSRQQNNRIDKQTKPTNRRYTGIELEEIRVEGQAVACYHKF
jgi:hypothetical protein